MLASSLLVCITVQLASKSSYLKRSIYEAIAEYSVASQALRDQWNQLVLQPLSKLEADSLQSPLILIIDALDECEDNVKIMSERKIIVHLE
jgi:hypothetical protein